jgi:signal transducing adaptor molecule
LAFEKGDIIKVVDRGYKDWWRGQLKGRTGIFPVNYVEAMPEPTAAELARESEQEAAVFSQAVNVEKLLNMLRALDPAKDNLADNEEIQELYRSSMALRPKIVKLIDKYSQKRADLVSMNETFVRARTIFDRMMEESLARHTGVYEQAPTFRVPQYGPPPQGRPDSRGAAGRRPEFGQPAQSGYGWNAPPAGPAGYPGYGAPANSYQATSPAPQQQPPQQYADPAAAYGGAAVGTPQGAPQQVPGGYGVVPQGGYAGHQPQAPYSQQGPTPYPIQQQPVQTPMQQQPVQQQPVQQPVQQQPIQQHQQPVQQPVQQQPIQQQPVQQQQPIQQQPIQPQPIQQQPIQQQPAQQQPVQQQPVQQAIQQPVQQQPAQQQPFQQEPTQQQPAQVAQQPQQHYPAQVQPDVQAAASPASAMSAQTQTQQPQVAEAQPQSQSPAQAQPAQPISGPPPYVYNPSHTYADPNVQAWAQYYTQGGKDLAGAVYFVSIPGVTDAPPASPQQVQPQQRQQSLQSHAQPQTASQPQQAQSELAYAADPARTASPTQQQPQQQISQQAHPQHAASGPSSPSNNAGPVIGSSPTQASNVPSWVIPKKTGPAGGPGDSYFPPTNQMAGVTLTDPGSGSAMSG